ncbi:ribosomal protein S5 domain 2-type protein [Gautieria morchelliformis]|nr:ribosomal protein S5 domain 2-type protein [Gautieria morchelliformis]
MTLVVSAPGKVLIAGGYLVLDQKYAGVVVSTSSRFYTIIRESGAASLIQVRSPQFINAEWEASVTIDDGRINLHDRDSTKSLSTNKFVYLAIQKVLSLVLEIKGKSALCLQLSRGLDITIVGDNDFYSQRSQLASLGLPSTIGSLKKISPFASTSVSLRDVHKTGLGSSAALITSLVTALLVHFSAITAESLSNDEGRSLAHNVAQYVHCLAQGKVGSGFDVSSAVFGSHIYRRFDPAVLAPLMSDNESEVSPLSVLSVSNPGWNHKVQPFCLPPGMRIMLADVDAGSDTPSLAGKVLRWRRDNPSEANELWDSLSARNDELASVLNTLTEAHASDAGTYDYILARAAALEYSKWSTLGITPQESEIVRKLTQTRSVAESIRAYMRQMGSASEVPIEPPEQTSLLDACLVKAGVVAGGVPGAGGYDAIWLLVLEPQPDIQPSPMSLVEGVWSSWRELDVSPLSAVESRERGVRIERLETVLGLKGILVKLEP